MWSAVWCSLGSDKRRTRARRSANSRNQHVAVWVYTPASHPATRISKLHIGRHRRRGGSYVLDLLQWLICQKNISCVPKKTFWMLGGDAVPNPVSNAGRGSFKHLSPSVCLSVCLSVACIGLPLLTLMVILQTDGAEFFKLSNKNAKSLQNCQICSFIMLLPEKRSGTKNT